MNKIFLEHLPHRGKLIDWKNSVGYFIHFIYEEIEGDLEVINYINEKHIKIEIKYNNNIYSISTGSIKNCNLGNILNKYTSAFKIEIGSILKDNNRDIIITNREHRKDSRGNNIKYYKYTCNKCGWTEGWMREYDAINGQGCGTCCNTPRNIVLGINTIWDTNKWMIPVINNDEFCKSHTYSCHDEIYPTCPDCGKIKERKMKICNIYYKHSIGCSCSDKISYPEKVMFAILEQLKLDFQTQLNKTTFNWCQDYRYDFFFKYNKEHFLIETHGNQHYEDTSGIFTKSAIETQENDKLKKELAITNGIKPENYIVIDCRRSELEFIKQNILNSRLNEVFDLSKIDWLKVEESALSNRVKEACDYKRNNPNMTTIEIGVIMKLHNITIRKYLKKGTKIGWCNYNAQEEEYRGRIKNSGNYSKRTVEIFKDGISLGVFESATELERQSEKLFKTKLFQGEISQVCLGRHKQYKGYTFKYIEGNFKQVI